MSILNTSPTTTIVDGASNELEQHHASRLSQNRQQYQRRRHQHQSSSPHASRNREETDKCCLYVCPLPSSFTYTYLKSLFEKECNVVVSRAYIQTNRDSLDKNVGFVHFKEANDASLALSIMNNKTIEGSFVPLQCKYANVSRSRNNSKTDALNESNPFLSLSLSSSSSSSSAHSYAPVEKNKNTTTNRYRHRYNPYSNPSIKRKGNHHGVGTMNTTFQVDDEYNPEEVSDWKTTTVATLPSACDVLNPNLSNTIPSYFTPSHPWSAMSSHAPPLLPLLPPVIPTSTIHPWPTMSTTDQAATTMSPSSLTKTSLQDIGDILNSILRQKANPCTNSIGSSSMTNNGGCYSGNDYPTSFHSRDPRKSLYANIAPADVPPTKKNGSSNPCSGASTAATAAATSTPLSEQQQSKDIFKALLQKLKDSTRS
jgi:hypothetical protein